MKTGTKVLQLSAVFPPVLAMLVGFSLFMKSRQEDELSRNLWVAETTFAEVLELNQSAGEYVQDHDPRAREQWITKYRALKGKALQKLDPGKDSEESTIFNAMMTAYENLGTGFDKLARHRRDTKPATEVIDSYETGLIRDLVLRSQTISSSALQLAQARHMNIVAQQQLTDAIIIVLSSIIALIMAAGAYMAVREEIAEREKVGVALRKSDVQLSDAFLKLRRASDQMMQAEKLHALEDMSKSVVREWQTTLAPVVSRMKRFAGTTKGMPAGDDLKEVLELLNRSFAKMSDEVERLEKFLVPASSGRGKQVSLIDVTEEAVKATQERWEDRPSWSRVEVVKDFQTVTPIYANQSDLCDVIKALIVNATEAMPKGGTLTLRTQQVGMWVGLEVSDTGIGMSEDVRKRCFEPFFSTKGTGAAGMGLTVSQAVVRQLHGTIEIESAHGKGTTIAVCLPVEKPVSLELRGVFDDSTSSRRKFRILVVDDESWTRLALVNNLLADGHTVESANDGRTGLAKFKEGDFEVVVADRAMPDMGGEELAQAVKAINPKTAVIMVTGKVDALREEEGQRSAADTVIGKPVQLGDLRRALMSATLHSKI